MTWSYPNFVPCYINRHHEEPWSLDPLCFYFSDLKWSCRHCLSCCPPLLCKGHGLPGVVTWITAPLELLSASSYQNITATNGQPVSLMHTYSKKVTRSIFVNISMQHIAGTSAWLRCMTKSHGTVTDDCSCEPSNTTPKPYTGIPTTTLPPKCYSPPGDSCDWYRNCLEKKYPCEDTSNAYAIKYTEKFCRLYDDRYSIFSSEGRKWVDAVRKCLQVSLVPILRPWYKLSCKDIRQRAFASHTPCYLNPDKDAPSICDLGFKDFLQIFLTIKSSFIQLDTSWESLKGMWNIGTGCAASYVKEALTKQLIKISKIEVKNVNRAKRSLSDPLPEADARSRFADQVGSAIAKALKWSTDVMDWLAYPENVTHADDHADISNIIIVLADIKALGIVSTSMPGINFNQTIKEFASAVAKGTLLLQVDGHNVWVKSLASCSDKSCNSTRVLAVSDKPPKWNKNSAHFAFCNLGLYGFTAILVIFLNKLFF